MEWVPNYTYTRQLEVDNDNSEDSPITKRGVENDYRGYYGIRRCWDIHSHP